MSAHDYTPEEALETLLSKLHQGSPALEASVRGAIDAGKDMSETVRGQGRGRRSRTYRKIVPFSHEEALQVGLNVLRAYFIEIPQCINSAIDNFRGTALGVPEHSSRPFHFDEPWAEPVIKELEGEEKAVEIELQTITQISKSFQETLPLKIVESQQVRDKEDKFKQLTQLVDFSEAQDNGDTR